ncbi:peptidoglycan-recognition protein SC2-like [Rhynchophorus ferrugineus]|uniref:peptidoglycan-recognition protein SC2-like n=1 Tax=Rhynchophorus ferrugineus TaxID=354439 RepID=UPI003FCD9680
MQSPVEMGQEKRCAAVSSSTTGNSVGVVSKKTPPQGDDAPLYRHVLNAQNRLIEQQATLIDRLTVNTCTDVALKKPTDITDILRQKSFKIWSLAFLMVLVVVALSLVFYLPLSLSPNPSSPIIPSSGHSDDLGDGIQIIQRHEWSARDPLNVTKISEPPKIVRIMHTAGFKCNSYQKCATQVLALQGWQVSSQGMPDVAYNYLIGGDGNVYVGRGADVQNEWMPNAIDIVYIGNYLSPYDQLTDKMEKAGRRLIARLRAEGKITQDYVVIAQNQTVNTQSPGENIFKEIIKWPHYDPSIYF